MARTALPVQQITRDGLTPAFTAANVDGHAIANAAHEYLHVKTTTTASNVILVTPGTVDAQPVGDRTIVLGTSAEALIGPFPVSIYNQPDTTDVHVNFSAITGVTVAAFRL